MINESKKYKEGDKVKYKTYFGATHLKVEGPEKVGRITRIAKRFLGMQYYYIDGLIVPGSYIIGLDEVLQTPFTNTGNRPIRRTFPV